jgi:hypothetical protein
MPWGRLDDGLYDHPKLDLLGRDRLRAVGLWTLSISWCNRRLTDGFVPCDRIRLLGGTPALADLLVSAGMFEERPGGYLIHDFLAFNDSAEIVQARRDAAADRQRKKRGVTPSSQRDSQRDKGVTDDDPDDMSRPRHSVTHSDVTRESHEHRARANGRASRPVPARPVPVLDEGSTRPTPIDSARAERPVDPLDEEAVPWLA